MHDDATPGHDVPNSPKRILLERGLRPRKRFGQNFLVDPRFAAQVASAVPADAFVIEIGAGTGSLTAALAQHARATLALEIDRDLVGILETRFAADPKVRVTCADALDFDLRGALERERSPRALCGNLPYYITTPLIERALDAIEWWDCGVFMVQREYAKRLAATPGSPDYGSLTVFVAVDCTVEKLFDIGAAGFYPQPDVSSSVVRLTPRRPRPALDGAARRVLTRTVRAAFAQRRKTLSNCISAAAPQSDRGAIDEAIRAAGLDPGVRGERLTLDDFMRLADRLAAASIELR